MSLPATQVEWKPSWRIIPSRFPPIQLFERVTPPDDLEAIFAVESLTNPRLRDEVGDIRLVPPEDRVSGPGSSIIMAAFTHLNSAGSRFTDGTYGVFYAANNLDTAIAETTYHRERFMRTTAEVRMELDMRVYLIDLAASLHDLRGRKAEFPIVYHNENYTAGQHLAATLRKEGSNGIAYDSVRHHGGECAAVFRARLLSNCRQERHLCYVWDGQRITAVYEKRSL
ncbi:RES family NAD+ phosphorylase [Acidiphilium sp. JA12-A1]|uniref:RES family NAD+ phosphorylase n=1 Tax=Acidiphilium sp. JA12-A1 TaxID=1464546 RepID=UPI0004614D75|nr:RES family NAD+ phosphorylase [Acidiphilium sp. JA12-A1]KDM65293.1 RES domain-containing protein [Acidiphilium sp. JA12-A1]